MSCCDCTYGITAKESGARFLHIAYFAYSVVIAATAEITFKGAAGIELLFPIRHATVPDAVGNPTSHPFPLVSFLQLA